MAKIWMQRGLQPQRSECKDRQMLTAPVRLFWMCICVSIPSPQVNLNLKYYILQQSRTRPVERTILCLKELWMSYLEKVTNQNKVRGNLAFAFIFVQVFLFQCSKDMTSFSKIRWHFLQSKFTGTAMLPVSLTKFCLHTANIENKAHLSGLKIALLYYIWLNAKNMKPLLILIYELLFHTESGHFKYICFHQPNTDQQASLLCVFSI